MDTIPENKGLCWYCGINPAEPKSKFCKSCERHFKRVEERAGKAAADMIRAKQKHKRCPRCKIMWIPKNWRLCSDCCWFELKGEEGNIYRKYDRGNATFQHFGLTGKPYILYGVKGDANRQPRED